MVIEVISAPATLLALAVIALGLAAWLVRQRLSGLAAALRGVGSAGREQLRFRGDQPGRRAGYPEHRRSPARHPDRDLQLECRRDHRRARDCFSRSGLGYLI